MSDEELDDLFRKATDSFEPVFEPDAWTAMEQKLDSVQPRQTWYKRLYPLLLLLLLVSLAVFWKQAAAPGPEATHAPDQTTATVQENPAVQEKLNTQPQQAAPQQGRTQQQPVAAHTIPKAAPETVAGTLPNAKTAVRLQLQHTGAAIVDVKAAAAEDRNVRENQREERTEAAPALLPPSAAADSVVVPAAASEASVLAQAAPDSAAAAADLEPALTDSVETTAPAVAAADSSQRQNKRAFLQHVTISLLVAPDVTTVKFKQPNAVSANAGISVSVPLTRKLSLVTGAVWADKVYNAAPEDYAPSQDFWQGKTLPTVIEAQCKVLDIPLNLQWRLLELKKGVLAIEAGLSSYLMLNEKYTYEYEGGYGSYSKVWEVANQNKHWFGVQNLSVSYTHRLSPAFSVGAAPFVKIPLTSIGAGHVQLTSAGIFLSAGYTIPLRK